MSDVRAGHHGNVSYVFEDNGFDTDPTDTTFKAFGGNATLDTFEGSHEAVRVFNADRTAADIVRQVFDGAWSVTHEITDPLWYLSTIFGQPVSTEVVEGVYEHEYRIDNNNDPNTLRLYLPTDGFQEYTVIPGAAVASVSIDQSQPGNPEVTVTGAYAREPFKDDTLTPEVPAFSKSSYTNRDAELTINNESVGRAQSTTVNLEANTEMVGEIGSGQSVDFSPKAFEPELSTEKILWVGQNVDFFSRFETFNQVAAVLSWDNGQTGTDEYSTELTVEDSAPNSWNESGRNDSDADLTEELSELGQSASVTITVDEATPPGM